MTPDPVKQKIQSLCPVVMELKPGCVVLFEFKPMRALYSAVVASEYGAGVGKEIWLDTGKGDRLYKIHKDGAEINKVYGSPITLAVVLRAMRTTTFAGVVDDIGDIYDQDEDYGEPVAHWNLEHDNYDQQSEETKQFIGSLLGV